MSVLVLCSQELPNRLIQRILFSSVGGFAQEDLNHNQALSQGGLCVRHK